MTRRDYCGVCNESVGDFGPTCGSCGISFHYECTRYKTEEGFFCPHFKELDDYCTEPYVNNNRINFETFMAIGDIGLSLDEDEIGDIGSSLDEDEIDEICDYKLECLDYFTCDHCHKNNEIILEKKSEISKLKKENIRLKILLLYNKLPVDILKHLDRFF